MADDKVVTLPFLQESACHKRWDSTVSYIKPFHPLALWANDLLCGNQPSQGWGARYSGRQKSFSLFLPKQAIKIHYPVPEKQ